MLPSLLLLAACHAEPPPETEAPPTGLTVAELRARPPSDQSHAVTAHVSRIYTCPPCPEGAQCKPCMGDNLVLSDEPKTLETWTLTATDVIVFADREDLETVKVGDRVDAQIEVREPPAPNGDAFHARAKKGSLSVRERP